MLPALAFAVVTTNLAATPILLDGELCHPTRLLVKSSSSPTGAAQAVGGKVLGRITQIGWSTVEVPLGTLKAAKTRMSKQPGVLNVEYDRAAQLAYTPNDPLWGDQWHMRTIKADLAWDTSKGSSNTLLALIDTGCLVTHPDLQGNIWTNPGEIPSNGIDDDNDGYVDDVNGYDFADNDGTPDDVLGHGTGCAGIIGAVQDNNIGVAGVCPNLKIMVLKACNSSGYLYDSYLVPAYVFGADHGARVFSMSYYSDRVSQAEKDAMDYAVGKGVLPVAAAGNDYSVIPYYPGGYENVLSVAATNNNNKKSGFSNYGSWVDVAAPGQNLTTTSANGDYMGFGGTSGACPHVAGAAALVFGAKPLATATEVRTALEDSATLLSQAPYGEFSNYGLINVQAALQAVLVTPAPPKPVVVRYASLIGIPQSTTSFVPSLTYRCRLYGRGFQSISNLIVKKLSKVCTIYARSRDWIDVKVETRAPGSLDVYDGATKLASVPTPNVPYICNPLVEASAPNSSVTGNFYSTLVTDGTTMDCTDDGQGGILMQGTFRLVKANSKKTLYIRRSYLLSGGLEDIQLYDWSSNSYPYGNWVTVSTASPSVTATDTTISVPDIARYIDLEGTVYVRIVASSVPVGDALKVDALRIQDNP